MADGSAEEFADAEIPQPASHSKSEPAIHEKDSKASSNDAVDSEPMRDMYNHLGELYLKQERYSEAEPLFRRAAAGYDRIQGPNDPPIFLTLKDLMKSIVIDQRVDGLEDILLRI